MLILLPTILLLGLAAALGAVRFFRPRSRFLWLGALGAVIGTWLVIFLWRFELPLSLEFAGWGALVALPAGLEFSVDSATWVIAWSLATLFLAGLIVGAAQPDFQPAGSWILLPLFGGMALLALSAANALSLVLVWGTLDLGEAAMALTGTREPDSAGKVVTAFAVRLATLVIAMMAQALGGTDPGQDGYVLLILVAILVRILVQWRSASDKPATHFGGSVGTALQLSSAVATLGALPRLGLAGAVWPHAGLLVSLCAAAALYAGWAWLRSPDLPAAFPHALAGISMLALGAALLRNPPGTAAWTAALALACGALFLSEGRKTSFAPAVLVGAWSLSALPFSLTGAGWPSQLGVEQWALPAFVVAQALMVAGFLRSAARPLARGTPREQLISLHAVRHLGIAFLLGIQLLLGIWGWQGAAVWQSLVPGTAASALGLILFAGTSRRGLGAETSSRGFQAFAGRALALTRDLTVGAYAVVGRVISGVTSLLEGQAGIMWGLLLLALFVSLIVGGNR